MALSKEEFQKLKSRLRAQKRSESKSAAETELGRKSGQGLPEDEFQELKKDLADQRSAQATGAFFPAETGEGPISAGLKAAGNVPSSMWGVGRGLFTAISNPIETVSNVKNIVEGGFETAGEALGRELGTREDTAEEDVAETEAEQSFDAFTQELRRRFGSIENLQRTATNDPFGFGSDVLGLITGAGAARRGLTTAGRTAQRAEAPTPQEAGGRAARLERKATEQIESTLRPTTKEAKTKTKRTVAPGLAKRKVREISLEGLSKRAQREIKAANEDLNTTLDNIPDDTRVRVEPILNELEDTKQQFVKQNKEGQNIIINEEGFKAATDLQEKIAQFGDDVDFKTLREVRQVWDKVVDKSKGFTKELKDFEKLNIQRQATNSIRRELARERPELDNINQELSFWLDAQDVIDETLKRTTGQTDGIGNKLFGAAGGLAGSQVSYQAFGDPVSGFLAGFNIGKKMSQVFQSPAWKTARAERKQRLAEAIARGDRKQVNSVLSTIIAEQGIDIIEEPEEKQQTEEEQRQ